MTTRLPRRLSRRATLPLGLVLGLAICLAMPAAPATAALAAPTISSFTGGQFRYSWRMSKLTPGPAITIGGRQL
jgi:hypothetical protein